MRARSKAERRRKQLEREVAYEEALIARDERRTKASPKMRISVATLAQPLVPTQWSYAPLPWLCQLAEYLSGPDLQRMAAVIVFPDSFTKSRPFLARLQISTKELKKEGAYTSSRPRKHRDYHHRCGQCDYPKPRPVRKCSQRDCGIYVCIVCDPFNAETKGSYTLCNDCQVNG